MSIISWIKRVTVQTAVYWGSPVDDGYGGKTFDSPIEINCRWDGMTEILFDNEGKEIVTEAQVLVREDLDEEGFLYLGSLSDLESDATPYDDGIDAYEIVAFKKIPLVMSTDKFVRTAILSKKK